MNNVLVVRTASTNSLHVKCFTQSISPVEERRQGGVVPEPTARALEKDRGDPKATGQPPLDAVSLLFVLSLLLLLLLLYFFLVLDAVLGDGTVEAGGANVGHSLRGPENEVAVSRVGVVGRLHRRTHQLARQRRVDEEVADEVAGEKEEEDEEEEERTKCANET